jgi:hypothetical protein
MHTDEKYGGFLTHGLTLSVKRKEESPYKPEAFDSRSSMVIAHVSTHKELQGFTKAIKLLSKSLI